jgi:hypothetical protein
MVPGMAAHFAETVEAGIGHDAGTDGVLLVAAFRARRWRRRSRSHGGELKRNTDELPPSDRAEGGKAMSEATIEVEQGERGPREGKGQPLTSLTSPIGPTRPVSHGAWEDLSMRPTSLSHQFR